VILAVAAVVVAAAAAVVPAGAAPDRAATVEVAAAPRPPLRLRHQCITAVERRRVVRFQAGDGTRLIGVLFGVGPRGIVLAHQGGMGAPGNLCAWVPYARVLASLGYRALVFDHRGFGSSDLPPRIRNLNRIDIDVVAAVRELRRRGVTSVVLGGASLGGVAVAVASPRIVPHVQGVMTFGAPSTFRGLDAEAALRRSDVPVLVTATEEDENGRFADDARRLYAAARAEDKRLAVLPGGEHGAPSLRRADVRAVVEPWLAAHSTT